MSNTVANKERVALKVGNLREYMQENPKAVSKSDKYGDSLWFDLTTWSDGSKSLGGYNSESKKRYDLGKVMENPKFEKPTTDNGSVFETTTETKKVEDDLPF